MGPVVHLKHTRTWALDEGFPPAEAELIARANLEFDRRYPARASAVNTTRHFSPAAWLWSVHYIDRAVRWGDLMMLGFGLHCAQDAVAHGTAGERHLLALAGVGRDPDSWDAAPAGIRRRIERVTRERLRRYRAARRSA